MPNAESSELPPFPLRVASILVAIVSALTGLVALFMLMSSHGTSANRINGAFALAFAAGLGAAAYLVWRQRKLGARIVIATLVLPTILGRIGTGVWHRPPLLLLLAALTLLATWPMLNEDNRNVPK